MKRNSIENYSFLYRILLIHSKGLLLCFYKKLYIIIQANFTLFTINENKLLLLLNQQNIDVQSQPLIV